MARHNSVGRVDDIIEQLEKLHKDAHSIFDTYVDELIRPGMSFGATKAQEIAAPAGSTLNYVAALKVLREKLIERSNPRSTRFWTRLHNEDWQWPVILMLHKPEPQTAH